MQPSDPAEDLSFIEALDDELRSLGDELHDTICQTLSGTGLIIENLLRTAQAGHPMPPDRLRHLKQIIERAIDETRALSRRLNPKLEGVGLMNALQELCIASAAEFKCEKPVFVTDTAAAAALYRIAERFCQPAHQPAQLELSTAEDGTVQLALHLRASTDATRHLLQHLQPYSTALHLEISPDQTLLRCRIATK